ncbi:major facilitator superfamily domain-containing protein [Aspergillus stella-maris]|uniref:major facilitator superfamily domain-containing protein n=1 Tax=Aspergillus stella-maris TaxID=1810926 RepID=UPI003CCDFABB
MQCAPGVNSNPKSDPPPDDGDLYAWSQILWCHFTICNSWGYLNAFGVFQTYYSATLSVPPSTISWIGSVQAFLLFFMATLSGRAADAGYFRLVWGIGAFLTLLGLFMASVAKTYWQLLLSQGICLGLGGGLMFCPVLSLIPQYFLRHRSLAIGVSASGSCTGGLIFPAVGQQLLPRVGLGWTMRLLGLLSFCMLVPSFLFLKQRIPSNKDSRRPLVDWSAFRDRTYVLFSIGMFFTFWGLYIAFFYVGSFGTDIVGVSQSTSTSMLLIMNGVGYPARILPNLLADRYKVAGPVNLLVPFILSTAVLLFCWTAVHSMAGLYIFSVFYGLVSAAVQSLYPAAANSLTIDLKSVGVRTGMVLTIVSFAALTGEPIAGALVQKGNGGYLYAQVFAASSTCVGCLCIAASRVARVGFGVGQRM